MIRLYTRETADRWLRRAKTLLWLALSLVGAALVICIVLCGRVNTGNAATLLVTCIALFTLAGWAGILLLVFAYAPARAQAEHMAGMFTQEEECFEGVLELHREYLHIPKSVTVRKATLHTDEGDVALSVCAGLSRSLPRGKRVKVLAVRKFITAYEVTA